MRVLNAMITAALGNLSYLLRQLAVAEKTKHVRNVKTRHGAQTMHDKQVRATTAGDRQQTFLHLSSSAQTKCLSCLIYIRNSVGPNPT